MKANRIFLIFTFIIFFGSLNLLFAQKTDSLKNKIVPIKSLIFAQDLEQFTSSNINKNQSILYQPSFKSSELPIFCKMEFLIHQKSQIPVKIRLGDVRYVDMLESKSKH